MTDRVNLQLAYSKLTSQGEDLAYGTTLQGTSRLLHTGNLSVSVGGELQALYQPRTLLYQSHIPCDVYSEDVFNKCVTTLTTLDEPSGYFSVRPTMTMSYQMSSFLNVQGSVGIGPEFLLKRGLRDKATTLYMQGITAKLGGSLILAFSENVDLSIGGGIKTTDDTFYLFVESGVAVHF